MPTSSDEPNVFVHDALSRGIDRADIEAALLEARWPKDKVRGALREYAEVDFPIPVPRPKPYLSAREAFLYLVLFTNLFLSAFYFGTILFELIEKAFPDSAAPSWSGRYSEDTLRWAVAFVMVSFPIFLFLTIRLGREIKEDPGKRASKVRRWLTYLTLFVAASFMVGDLVTLIHHFLAGEMTIRFVLKALVIAVIAGTAFTYYLRDLRQEETWQEAS